MSNNKVSENVVNSNIEASVESENISLSFKLQTIINNLPEDKVTLREIRSLLGTEGMLLFIALLTLIFMIPVSIPGLSTIFGGTILLITLSLIIRKNLWLPEKFLRKELPSEKLRNGLYKGLKWFKKLEKISKPYRLKWLTNNKLISFINYLSMILATILLMFPFGLIPFSNTLPALALLFYSIGILQKDGASILLGHLSVIGTIIYFSILITGGGYVIMEVFKFLS